MCDKPNSLYIHVDMTYYYADIRQHLDVDDCVMCYKTPMCNHADFV